MADNQPSQAPGTTEPSNVGEPAVDPVGSQVWRAHIPGDLKDKGYWKPLENSALSDVLKSYGHAQERLGKSITVPDKPDDADGWSKIYTKLGRPEKPEGYTYNTPKVDGVEWNPEAFSRFNKKAFDLGLSAKQVSGVIDWMGEDLQQTLRQAQDKDNETRAVTEVKLKKEFGTQYDMKYALAKRAGNTYFGEEITNELLQTMNESVVKGLMTLGTQLAEDKAFGDNPVELRGAISKEDALREIAAMGADRSNPYWDSRNPLHGEAVQKMENLHKIAFPEA